MSTLVTLHRFSSSKPFRTAYTICEGHSATSILCYQRRGNDLLPVGVNLVPLRLCSLDGNLANLCCLLNGVALLGAVWLAGLDAMYDEVFGGGHVRVLGCS